MEENNKHFIRNHLQISASITLVSLTKEPQIKQ